MGNIRSFGFGRASTPKNYISGAEIRRLAKRVRRKKPSAWKQALVRLFGPQACEDKRQTGGR